MVKGDLKEMSVARRIYNIYNKREEDFGSLSDYNDYLEEVEDIVLNLVEGINVRTLEAKVARYKKENADQIMNSKARKAEELAAALSASKGLPMRSENNMSAQLHNGSGAGTQCQYVPTIGSVSMAQPRPTQPVPIVSKNNMTAQHHNGSAAGTQSQYVQTIASFSMARAQPTQPIPTVSNINVPTQHHNGSSAGTQRQYVPMIASVSMAQPRPIQPIPIVSNINMPAQHHNGINTGTKWQYVPTIASFSMAQPRLIQPIPIVSNNNMPGQNQNGKDLMSLQAERCERAGGWSLRLSRKRALEEAFSTIWT